MMPVTYKFAARKTLRKIPQNTAKWIVRKYGDYAENPALQKKHIETYRAAKSSGYV
jgi:hypothetical protein